MLLLQNRIGQSRMALDTIFVGNSPLVHTLEGCVLGRGVVELTNLEVNREHGWFENGRCV